MPKTITEQDRIERAAQRRKRKLDAALKAGEITPAAQAVHDLEVRALEVQVRQKLANLRLAAKYHATDGRPPKKDA